MAGIKFPLNISNNHLIGFVSLPHLGNEVRIASLPGYCRVKVKSLHHELRLTELSLLQLHDPAKFIMFCSSVPFLRRLCTQDLNGRHVQW